MSQDLCIMLVDDNDDFLEVLGMDVEDLGFPIVTARNVDEAFAKLRSEKVDIIVSDLHMEGKSGMDFIFELRENHQLIPFIFLTGAATKAVAVEALRAGAFDLLEKPIEPAELARVLNSAGKLAKNIQIETKAEQATSSDAQTNRLVQLRSSAAAFDDLTHESGHSKAKSSQSPRASDLATTQFQIKTQIGEILVRSSKAVELLHDPKFAQTALSFLSRSYNLIRESAVQINDKPLAEASESACNCFSFYRVNPKAMTGNHIQLFQEYNGFLADLNSEGSAALKKHETIRVSIKRVERKINETAA